MGVESRLSASNGGQGGVLPVLGEEEDGPATHRTGRAALGDDGSVPGAGAGQEFCLIRLVSSAIWLYSERRSAIC
jgi:hypothetical protein